MRWTSASTATSPETASAWPPVASTFFTVSVAAAASMSATMTRAPSSANSTAASRPMPAPAPVMNATLFLSRSAMPSSNPFEVADQLPVRHRLIERLLLEPRGMQVVVDDTVAERGACDAALLELADRFAERLRDLGQRGVLVGVALVGLRRLQLARDAMQAGRDRRREGEVRIGVGARDAVLDAKRCALTTQAKATRPVVPARHDARRRERAGLVALVRVHARRVEIRELARHRHLAGEPLAEERRPRVAAVARAAGGRREERLAPRAVPQRAVEVKRRAGRRHVVLRHERQRAPVQMRDLLGPVLVQR